MPPIKKITEAKTTCDGLHRLIRKLNVAAVDLDKSGGSAYELIGLLASTHACVSSLSTQLDDIANSTELMNSEAQPTAATEDSDTPLDTETVIALRRAQG